MASLPLLAAMHCLNICAQYVKHPLTIHLKTNMHSTPERTIHSKRLPASGAGVTGDPKEARGLVAFEAAPHAGI